MTNRKKVICPTDFSEASFRALATAVELAEQTPYEICVVYVEPADEAIAPLADLRLGAEYATNRHVAAVQNLCSVLEEHVPSHISTRPILKFGDAATQIVATATEEGADLIVLTTHGAGQSSPATLGSVAESILRNAPCPVLTIRATPTPAQTALLAFDHSNNDPSLRPDRELVHTHHELYLDGD